MVKYLFDRKTQIAMKIKVVGRRKKNDMPTKAISSHFFPRQEKKIPTKKSFINF